MAKAKKTGSKAKSGSSKTVKKTKSKTTSNKKNVKKTANQKPIKTVSRPDSMRRQAMSGNEVLQQTHAINRKKKKPKKSNSMEKAFWIIILLIFISVFAAGFYFVFDDYFADPSTPAQKAAKDLTSEEMTYLENMASTSTVIESVDVTQQGPIIYVVYTVPAGTTRDVAIKEAGGVLAKASEENPELIDAYDFQLTIINSGEEAEGVNTFPIMGSRNSNSKKIVWMKADGNFEEPEPAVEDVPTE